MFQIHVQWSHFSRLLVTVDFDDVSLQKYGQLIICIIIVIYINGVCYRGSSEMSQIHVQCGHTFGGCWLLLIFDDFSLQKYGQLII